MLLTLAETRINEMKQRPPVIVAPDTPLKVAVDLTLQHRRGSVLICDADGGLVGIFTSRDLVTRIDHNDLAWHTRPVSDLMSRNPVTIGRDASLAEAMELMRNKAIRTLPVVEDGQAVGVLSIRDILRHIAESFPDTFLNLPPDPSLEATSRWGG